MKVLASLKTLRFKIVYNSVGPFIFQPKKTNFKPSDINVFRLLFFSLNLIFYHDYSYLTCLVYIGGVSKIWITDNDTYNSFISYYLRYVVKRSNLMLIPAKDTIKMLPIIVSGIYKLTEVPWHTKSRNFSGCTVRTLNERMLRWP